ncbi:ArsI/CadI family heavy metal resistance metalloenzyme [Ekhidna sp.]|uniref:ArsI/CadI family heavy metal resistance metalloenzyme n=1 Tax=Ekhidna sp. TaxID=2608089 RepID=UPI003BABCFD3
MEQKNVFPRTHISLFVSDISETVQFYDKFFNEGAAKVKEDYAKYELDAPALTISFIQNPKKVNAEIGHFGIQVKTKEELNDKLNLARGQKLVQLEEAETACCYAIQDKFWVNDPDGYEWEVYHFLGDLEEKEEKQAAACC